MNMSFQLWPFFSFSVRCIALFSIHECQLTIFCCLSQCFIVLFMLLELLELGYCVIVSYWDPNIECQCHKQSVEMMFKCQLSGFHEFSSFSFSIFCTMQMEMQTCTLCFEQFKMEWANFGACSMSLYIILWISVCL